MAVVPDDTARYTHMKKSDFWKNKIYIYIFFSIKCSQIEQEIVEGRMRAQLLPPESKG